MTSPFYMDFDIYVKLYIYASHNQIGKANAMQINRIVYMRNKSKSSEELKIALHDMNVITSYELCDLLYIMKKNANIYPINDQQYIFEYIMKNLIYSKTQKESTISLIDECKKHTITRIIRETMILSPQILNHILFHYIYN